MILVIGGIKGGSGRSTLLSNLAVLRSQDGHEVLVIDADDQGSAADFKRQRDTRTGDTSGYTLIQSFERDVLNQARDLGPKYDDVLIDVGGRDTSSQRAALAVADKVLIPFTPTSIDLWTDEKLAKLLDEIKTFNPTLSAHVVLNKAFPRGTDNQDAQELLAESDAWTLAPGLIGLRKAFSTAFGMGFAVTEYQPKDPKAIDEITVLYRYIFGIE